MVQHSLDEASHFARIAPGAIRGRYHQAAWYVLLAPFPTLLKGNSLALAAAVMIWFVLRWQFDRWRLGPDYQAVWKSEQSFLRTAGFAPHFFGLAWSLVVWLVLDSAVREVVKTSVATGLLLALAGGALCQGAWLSHKLRSGVWSKSAQ